MQRFSPFTGSRSQVIQSTKKLINSSVSTRQYTGTLPGQNVRVTVQNQLLPPSESGLFKHSPYPRTVAMIGAPMTYGQPYVGTDTGPALLREKGLRGMLTSLGWRVEELPDLDFDSIIKDLPDDMVDPPSAKNCALVGNGTSLLADAVEKAITEGKFPLVLGGDHSIGLGSLTGILRKNPNVGIIWVDAHADLNTPNTSLSGNMHGMPLGMLFNHPTEPQVDFSKYPGFEYLIDSPRINPDQLVYIGLRDVDQAERQWIRESGIKAFTMYDIDHLGIGQVMDRTFEHLLKDDPDRPLHLSYDIDAVDPALAPATGTTVRGGLTYREAHFVAEALAQSGNLASAEIVELNVKLSNIAGGDDTVELALQLITSFMGKSII
eukprot:Nitzschia sp. Nitz4//scaffold119_size111653//4704//6100//NITZ4_004173-RA/size111653-augustus-gene-0.204-mRNA-1//1//CDS//3329533785//388//frame0